MQLERPLLRCEALARRQHNLLSRRQALECGLSASAIDRLVASGRWRAVLPGVYVLPGTPPSWSGALMAACLWPPEITAASHRSAGALWRLSGFGPGPVEITTIKEARARAGIEVHHAQLTAVDVSAIDGIPVTTVPRTLLDLGAVVDIGEVEAALEDALRRRLVSLPRLRWTLTRLGKRGRPGTAALRKLVEARGRGYTATESPLELQLVRALRRARLPEPVRQLRIRDRGRVIARVDLAYPEARLAIEADGYEFHSARREWQRDRRVQNALTLRGWRVLRVTAEDLEHRSEAVAAEVRAALERTRDPQV